MDAVRLSFLKIGSNSFPTTEEYLLYYNKTFVTTVYILTVFLSNRGKNPAKYGAKEAPPTAVAREGRMSPAYSISMASNSACWSDSSTSSSSPCWQAVWRKRRQKAL